jgi:hypothetical protein
VKSYLAAAELKNPFTIIVGEMAVAILRNHKA